MAVPGHARVFVELVRRVELTTPQRIIHELLERRLPNEPGAPWFTPTRINVSTDWSFGSSGAAVLDESGNAIGQVSTISVEGGDESVNTSVTPEAASATIVFHEAVSARDVAALVKQSN